MKKINLTEYIRKSAVQVSLSDSERERMKRVLSEYVSMKPMRNAPLSRRAPLSHAFLSIYAFSRRSIAGLLVFAILFSGAGVSFAAENALPGDALYPIKVDINEPVVAALSVSSESKTLWNAERAERRLEEAAKLASENRLTDAAGLELAERFEKHAESVALDVEELEDEDSESAIGIASRFENTLLAHESVLEDSEKSERIRTLNSRIQEKAERFSRVSTRNRPSASSPVAVADTARSVAMFSAPAVEDTANSTTFAMKSAPVEEVALMSSDFVQESIPDEKINKMARSAKRELEDVGKIFKRLAGRLDTETAARVTAQISVAQLFLRDGDTFRSNGDSVGAFEAYRQSVGVSAKLAVLLKAFQKERLRVIPANLGVQISVHEGTDDNDDAKTEDVREEKDSSGGENDGSSDD